MLKRHYLTGVLVLLSLAAGSAVASAAETGVNVRNNAVQGVAYRYDPYGTYNGYRGYYNYAAPPAAYGYGNPWYEQQWDPYTWSTGNGYY
jgi:hypothetical protein